MKRIPRAVARPRRISPTPAQAFRDPARCAEVVRALSLLANEKRLRILCALLDRERSVAEIVAEVGGKFSAISQQLKLLSLAGLIAGQRSAKSVIYRLIDPRVGRILHFLKDEFPAS